MSKKDEKPWFDLTYDELKQETERVKRIQDEHFRGAEE